MSQNSQRLRFEIIQQGQVVGSQEFAQDVIKVGKLASSHLRLEDPNVSRIHAVIEKGASGAYSVIDLGSASGTFLNGEKITKAELASGDELTFGDTLVRFSFVEVSAAPQPSAASAASAAAQATDATLAPAAAVQVAVQTVTLEDGTEVEPYAAQGYYDDHGNYIPFWYDEFGQAQPGYGYYDDAGNWQVAFGYYDPQGEWVATEEAAGWGEPVVAGPPDSDIYQEEFFAGSGGSTLEVAMLWADHVLTVSSFPTPRTVQIGPDYKNDFVVDESTIAQNETFPLIAYQGGAWAVTFTPDMDGLIQDGETRYTLKEAVERGLARPSATVAGGHEMAMGTNTNARIDVGETTFLVHFTDMPAVIGGGFSMDTDPVPFIALSAAAHILFLLLVLNMPDNANSLNLDGFKAHDRFVELLAKPEQEEPDEKPNWLDDKKGDEEAAAKHKGDEGQAGKQDAPDDDKRMGIKGPPDNEELQVRKAHDTQVAMQAGVMAVFNSNQVSSMWGSGDTSVGSDAIHAIGRVDSAGAVGTAKGFGGFGVSGAGRGGGGVSERGFGLANVGTAGRGGGGRGGDNYGAQASNLGEKSDKLPSVIPGPPVVTGSLDKEIIRRVVRRHRREISYCYEKELQKDKTLQGQVTVKFTISGTGSVIAAVVSATTMKNRTVESCITDKVRRWVFPEPKGGGIVVVNYPFNFSRQ